MIRISMLVVLLACSSVTTAAEPSKTILSSQSRWRWHKTMRPPLVPVKELEAAGKKAGKPQPLRGRGCDHHRTQPPPANWRAVDFADAPWPRAKIARLRPIASAHFSTGLLCLRGKFRVTDPAAVKKLVLQMSFLGGAVVYLNGAEVARAQMPDGKLTPDTPAVQYPKEAYVKSDGKPIPALRVLRYLMKRRGDKGRIPADVTGGIAKRVRRLGPVDLPTKHLRAGINVLAIELHRSDYPAAALQWFGRMSPQWLPLGLGSIHLTAEGGGIAPNAARRKEFHVWSRDIHTRLTPADYGDPNEPDRPVRIVAARNGTFCGMLGVGADGPIKGLAASVTDLTSADGKNKIAAASVDLLYGSVGRTMPGWYDNVHEATPSLVPAKVYRRRRVEPSDGAAVPIIVRARVPADAAPGDYRGSVTVRAEGAEPRTLPVELHVTGWTVPDPKKYRTYIGVYQSPTSTYMQYKVEPWGKEHMRLLGEAFRLLGRLGNKLVLVHAVENTQFGNERGMIHWIKQADGSWKHDYSIFEKYLDLAIQHCGKPDYVALQVWHASNTWGTRPPDTRCTVTVRDPKTGKLSSMQVPVFGTKESRALWKPVIDGVMKRLADRGIDGRNGRLLMGIFGESTAPPQVSKMFDELVPGGAYWMQGCHRGTDAMKPIPIQKRRGGGRIALLEHCYGMSMTSPNAKKLPPIHTFRGRPGTAYFRYGGHEATVSLVGYHTMAPRALWTRKQGVGRVCLDWWKVLRSPRGRSSGLYNRYPFSSCAQRAPALMRLTWPGPKGHRPTIRFEMMAESIQLAEALIVISKAMHQHGANLDKELAAKCEQVLRDQLRFCHARFMWRPGVSSADPDHLGWQEMTRRVFDCAAEVSNVSKESGRER
jgi:glycosyl hydrolase family 123